ncbi:mitochondrial carrier domain-containing protein [Lipomyces mesembrius]
MERSDNHLGTSHQSPREILLRPPLKPAVPDNRYIGFVAGIFSGVTKLFVGYPIDRLQICGKFDTIKVRLQTAPANHQLGSLHNYRLLMKQYFSRLGKLPPQWHAIAGNFAGWTVSLLRRQLNTLSRFIVRLAGIRGLYRGLCSTVVFHSYSFFCGWAGRLSAQIFWTLAYPSDVVEQTIMTDNVTDPRHKMWIDGARYVYNERGFKGFFRGSVPSCSRAFPANAAAFAMFAMVIRTLA